MNDRMKKKENYLWGLEIWRLNERMWQQDALSENSTHRIQNPFDKQKLNKKLHNFKGSFALGILRRIFHIFNGLFLSFLRDREKFNFFDFSSNLPEK